MRNSLSKLQYLLFALLMTALTGCGASNLAGVADNNAPGSISAKLVWGEGKSTAKTVAAAPTGVTSIQVIVTGTGLDGKDVPVVRGTIDATSNSGTIGGIYPGKVTLAIKALSGSTVSYEGFAIGVVVNAGATTTIADPIVMTAPTIKTENQACEACHETKLDKTGQNLVADYKQSGHYTNTAWTTNVNGATQAGCAGCHGTQHNDTNPATGRCAACHNISSPVAHNGNSATSMAGLSGQCSSCHNSHNTTQFVSAGCTDCHSVSQNATPDGSLNSGVRAITGEFNKTSHHVTGRAPTNTDCAVCHLEGTKSGAAVVVNTGFHMNADIIDLRNGNPALAGNQSKAVGAGYPWNPAVPDHTLMDQFCFSCHNEAGAPAAATALAGVTGYTGTALNPFGDSISNSYDQVSRLAVVGVYEQFDTGNTSHHAVRGAKYTKASIQTAGVPNTVGDVTIFSNISTANAANGQWGVGGDVGIKNIIGSMKDLGLFTATYTTLDGATLADNSTLHCGDCHTVGQFRASDVNTAAGSFNKAVIGAHGSNNEYMLRNSNGDDVQAKDALVCYICHAEASYQGHDGANANATYCNGNEYNTAGLVGAARLKVGAYSSVAGRTVEQFNAQVAAGTAPAAGGGNIFGIKCINCHNASDKKTFGGIHGNAGNATYKTYSGTKDAMNGGDVAVVNRQPYRFLPGLGNFRYNGGDSADQWTVKSLLQANKQGCYTLNGASTIARQVTPPDYSIISNPSPTKATAAGANVSPLAKADGGDNGILGSWGACTDHAGTSVFGGRAATRTILRPLSY